MASTKRSRSRNSYIPLSVKPVNYSLTAGTNIPTPIESPPISPISYARPPTPGRGPLNSHPTTSDDMSMPGAFPPTPDPEKDSAAAKVSSSYSNARETRADSFRTPMSPASATPTASSPEQPQPQRRATGVRKLLSLSSLRSSFSSSRTSHSLPRQLSDNRPPTNGTSRPPPTGTKRPASPGPSLISTTASSYNAHPASYNQQRPELRMKKSASWFRRKSGMFMMNDENQMALDEVDENSRPETRDSKRFKESDPAPMLPDIGGSLDDGEIGWDEQYFKR